MTQGRRSLVITRKQIPSEIILFFEWKKTSLRLFYPLQSSKRLDQVSKATTTPASTIKKPTAVDDE
jgi:hypothetical protein